MTMMTAGGTGRRHIFIKAVDILLKIYNNIIKGNNASVGEVTAGIRIAAAKEWKHSLYW